MTGEPHSSTSTCEDFLEACASALRFLVRNHGFEVCEPERFGYEHSLAYRKPPNMVLVVYYEPGEAPWLIAKARLDAETRRTFNTPLHTLARRRVKGWRLPRLGDGPRAQAIGAVLRCYAELLEQDLPEVLEAADGIGNRLKGSG